MVLGIRSRGKRKARTTERQGGREVGKEERRRERSGEGNEKEGERESRRERRWRESRTKVLQKLMTKKEKLNKIRIIYLNQFSETLDLR